MSEDVNLFAQQEANRRKSRWIVIAFVLFFAWLGFGGDFIVWLAAQQGADIPWQPGFPLLGVVMLLVAFGLLYYVRSHGAERVLWSTGARELTDPVTDDERRYANVVEEMAIAAGVSKPRIWVIEDADPNAFATGNDPAKSHVAVTTGLLAALDRDELQAVIGHEYGHIKNLDTKLMTFLAAAVGAVVLMRDGMWRAIRFGFGRGGGGGGGGGGRRRGKGGGANQLVIILLVLWLISWMLAPLVIRLLSLWVSRKREYLADAMSAQFTRNPGALASALEKIHASHLPTHAIKAGAAHLCIDDPLGRKLDDREGRFADAFATHPPMAIRIARLKAMGYQSAKREAATA
jgi:heat shock protein HtpX